jgi:hypothetical protein
LDDAKEHLPVSRSYNRTVNPDPAQSGSGTPAPKRPSGPWIRHTNRAADVDVRILSDRTDDGGTITRLVDSQGKRLRADPIVGRPGREDEVALVIANTVTELLRRA